MHKINDGLEPIYVKTTNSENINIQFDYGNPFENRLRKPFDFFKLRTEFDLGIGRKVLSNVIGYGVLLSKNLNFENHSMLIGLFQYCDYWDNKTFELGTIGFGAGLFSKLTLSKTFQFYSNVHMALVPLAGNSMSFSSDTAQARDYNYGYGLEGKFESTLNIGKFATASLVYYYYMIQTYAGIRGVTLMGILKPRVTVRLFKDLSIGFEHFVYFNDSYMQDMPFFHSVRTEQKLFLEIYLEDRQRRGHYN